MNLPAIKITQGSLQNDWPQICLQLALVIFFCGNIAGIFDFSSTSSLGINIRPGIFFSASGELQLPSTSTTLDFFLIVVSGTSLAFLLPLLTPIAASLLIFLFALPPVTINLSNPLRDSIIPMQYSLLVLLMLFGMNVLVNYFLETQRKQKLIGAFGKFVPPEIVAQLNRQPEIVNLDGESKTLSVLFCDLKNFTGISEQLDPKQLVGLLNEYFTEMTTVLYQHGATIDKYIGDSIMAFWGAPLPQDDHAQRAVSAAMQMQEELKELSESLSKRNLPALDMGVGINTGTMNVGNMGSTYRLAYTVVGDSVNLSSRLESLTRTYKAPIIVGENTVTASNNAIAYMELDTVAVKGKEISSRIYQPIGNKSSITAEMQNQLTRHEEAMTIYYSGKNTDAIEAFEALATQHANWSEYYQYMISKLRNNPIDHSNS